MQHVARICPETQLLITEVTQAEFDALPSYWSDANAGDSWREGMVLICCTDRWSVYGKEHTSRSLVIVDQVEPA